MTKHYYLTPVLGGPGAPRYPISEEPQLIGRSERAAVALLEPTVSREHAAIQSREGMVYLEDLGSKHGTFVNSKRVTSTKLKVGDIIVFGLSLVLRLEESDEPLPAMEHERIGAPEHTVSAVQPLPHGSALPRRSRPTEGTARIHRASGPDAEQQHRLLDQLARARKLAAAGALCALRLPALLSSLSEVGRALDKSAPNPQAEQLRAILGDLRGIVQAINVPVPPLRAVALLEVVNEAVSTVQVQAEPRGIQLLIGVPAVEVHAERSRLYAALVEILRSATAASGDDQTIEVKAEPRGETVQLTIADPGRGLTEEVAARVFDPFFTLSDDRDAVGLGLYEARQLLMSMGGSLELRQGQPGTMVEIVLPRAG